MTDVTLAGLELVIEGAFSSYTYTWSLVGGQALTSLAF